MSLSEAERIIPDAVFLPCNPPRYFDLSGRMLRILLQRTPLVEPSSIDEAFLDAAGLARTLDEGDALAGSIQEEIERKLGLSSSAGIAPNKRIAKAASSERKPGGRTVLDVDAYRARFSGRSVTALDGVGEMTATRLADEGIRSVGDLAAAPPSFLRNILGSRGPLLREAARGEDDSPVVPIHSAPDPRSLGHEYTLHRDESDREAIRRVILALSEEVAWDLQDEKMIPDTIHLSVRWGKGGTGSRQSRVREGTSSARAIFRIALELFRCLDDGGGVRTVGISVSGLERFDPERGRGVSSGDLFGSGKEERIDAVTGTLRSIYGRGVLRRAFLLRESPRVKGT
jgi:DNA polymerase-4